MRGSISAAMLRGPAREADGTCGFEFKFPADDPVFAGHFPGHPLLPGVFQLEMTRICTEIVIGEPLAIREIVKAKFLRPVLPEETIRLSLKLREEESIIHARALLAAGGQTAGEALIRLCRHAKANG